MVVATAGGSGSIWVLTTAQGQSQESLGSFFKIPIEARCSKVRQISVFYEAGMVNSEPESPIFSGLP